MKSVKSEKEVLYLYYSRKLKELSKKASQKPPEFNVKKLNPYIRFQERKLRYLSEISTVVNIITYLQNSIK